MPLRPACDVLRSVLRPTAGVPPEVTILPRGMPSLRIRLGQLVDDGNGEQVSRELPYQVQQDWLMECAEATLVSWANAIERASGVSFQVIQVHTSPEEAPPVEIPCLSSAVRPAFIRSLSARMCERGAYAHCDIVRRAGQPLQVQSIRLTQMGGGYDEWCQDEDVRVAFERWSDAAVPLLGTSIQLVFLMEVPPPSGHERMRIAARAVRPASAP